MKKIALIAIAVLLSINSVFAQAPERFNYQGVARQANGAFIANQSLGLRISILDGSATGTPLYVERHTTTTNQFGMYNVAVGGGTVVSGSMSSITWGSSNKFIKVEIDPAGGTNYTDLGASQLLSVPFALYSNTGVPGPQGPQGPTGPQGAQGPAGNANISGTTNNLIKFTGTTTGGNSGVVESSGNIGIGVTSPLAKTHIIGSSNTTVTLGGVSFDHNALVAQTSSSSTTSNSRAIVGYSGNSSVENQGLFGFANGGSTGNNVGVFGLAAPSSSSSGNSFGLYGSAASGTVNVGVYGTYSGSGWAGYFNGAVNVNGALSKSSGTFKIDHPLDPENKYLYHSFVESPDMMNVYNGNITTDGNGVAVVELPGYFEALNKDFRYQLTVIGTFAQAIVAEKVSGNQFTIKTNQPNVEVSWQVTGIRKDKYAEAHRVVPEVEKEDYFKGYYLHPKEFGKAVTQGIEYKMAPASTKEMLLKDKK